MTTESLWRIWRIVGPDYRPPEQHLIARERIAHVYRHERQLRRRIEDGEPVPTGVRLVSPEIGVEVEAGPVNVAGLYAWREQQDLFQHGLSHVGNVTAIGRINEARAVPDETPHFAERGSVRLIAGRLGVLAVRPWARPLAEQLADRYNVEVRVAPGINPPRPRVETAPAIVEHDVLPISMLDGLVRDFEVRCSDPTQLVPARSGDVGKTILKTIAPPLIQDALLTVGEQALRSLGLPVADQFMIGRMRYSTGGEHLWHIDNAEDIDRVAAYSLLLSEPDRDFFGGQFETRDDGVVPMRRGTMVAITGATWHRVRPVVSGHRLVVVCFAQLDR